MEVHLKAHQRLNQSELLSGIPLMNASLKWHFHVAKCDDKQCSGGCVKRQAASRDALWTTFPKIELWSRFEVKYVLSSSSLKLGYECRKYGNKETEHLIKMPQSSDDGYLAVCGSPTNICAYTHEHTHTFLLLLF